MHTDASGWGLGACLHIVHENEELPVAFYSRQLQGAEKHYSITELESLAIVAAIEHFEYFLYGALVMVITDHQACTSFLTSKQLNRRLQRLVLKLKAWDVTVQFRPGRLNSNADGLSRQGEIEEVSSLDVPVHCQLASPDASLAWGDVGPPSSFSS